MSAKRFLLTFALAALLAATGCRTWCERHYPCPTPYPATAAAPCCVPCTPTVGYSPAPVQSWTTPSVGPKNCRCTCD